MKKITMFVSFSLNIILAIALYMSSNLNSQDSSILGTFQCRDFSIDGSAVTFAFEQDGITIYDYSFYREGKYLKEGNNYTLTFDDEEYIITLKDDAFVFPIINENVTSMCNFIKVSEIPIYQERERR